MKKIFFLSFLFLSFNLSSQIKEDLVIPKNPKIGLSLSGGGAKGFAHIGVLKVLDSLGVRIDYVSGTSMGAIVGGLYASGYSGKDIEKIMNETDFYSVINNKKQRQEATFFDKTVDKYIVSFPIKQKKISLPSSLTKGQKTIYILKELFKNVSHINDFSELPIPFMCVATNLETGETKIFEEGDLVKSILASSAFPSLIDPVKIGDEIYVDGAMAINYPSKPLKDKDIDIVIGVNLSTGLNEKEQITNIVDILNQIIDFGIQKEVDNQLKYTDINIHPNLQGMKVTSFDQKQSIRDAGTSEALKYVEILNQLPKRQNEDIIKIPINPIYSNHYRIDSLSVENSFLYNKDYIQGKMGLKIPSVQTYNSINKMIDKLYATNNFNIIKYDLVNEFGKNTLKIAVDEIRDQYMLKFGLHYDKIFKTGLLSNITIKRLIFNNSTISFDFVIGDNPRYYLNYFLDNGFYPSFGAHFSGISFDIKNNKDFATEQWRWLRNEVFVQSTWRDKYAIGGGISLDYFDITNNIENTKNFQKFLNPHIFVKADTQNDKDFPTKGFAINIEGKYIDFFKNDLHNYFQFKGKIDLSFPVNNWLSYRLEGFAGFSTDNPSLFYQYRLGGIFGQDLANFFPFNGYLLGEKTDNNMAGATHSLIFNFKNYYIIPSFGIADTFESFKDFKILETTYTSLGLTLGYKSPFGQIKINYSTPLHKNIKGHFNVILGHWF